MAQRPLFFNSFMMSAKNKSAVSLVLNFLGKLVSVPSSSTPPKGGLERIISSLSLAPQSAYGLLNKLSLRTTGKSKP